MKESYSYNSWSGKESSGHGLFKELAGIKTFLCSVYSSDPVQEEETKGFLSCLREIGVDVNITVDFDCTSKCGKQLLSFFVPYCFFSWFYILMVQV